MSDVEFEAGGDVLQPKSSKTKSKKPKTIEETYKKVTQHEHILGRPDTYIGSIEKATQEMWVYDSTEEKMISKQVSFAPGLFKIFDEIIVNAADNKQRDPKNCNTIKIDIDVENNRIKIWNNGKGIEVTEHKTEKMWVPQLIFGHLLTSSNYDDSEEKTTGGRNGYGAKLTNIYSTRFVVETSSKQFKKRFKMEWKKNMFSPGKPKVDPSDLSDFTRITFEPDLEKFGMTHLDQDIVDVFTRRAYDCAATSGCKVFLNGEKLKVNNFKDYCDLFIKGQIDNAGNQAKLLYKKINDHWEVAVGVSESGFKHMSFVNSIATVKGGKHLDYVTNQITKHLKETVGKKVKNTKITDFYIKNHMWVFVNSLISNPSFDSQTKENMTLVSSKFKFPCKLEDNFLKQIEKSGLASAVQNFAEFKNMKKLENKGGHKTSKVKVKKLEDANLAGTKDAQKCTLILTEGDSAKSTAVAGRGVVSKGNDIYGIYPLRGKLLNVREAPSAQITNNAEISDLCKIVGLDYKNKYADPLDLKKLRYGKIMIMTDQDHDGSHIKGLVINFIHSKWPNLLKHNMIEEFITPIVKVSKGQTELSFYSMPEFEEWQNDTPAADKWSIKYYKGLGTSSSKEAKEYFSDMKRHKIPFRYGGEECDKSIELAFAKKHVDDRKTWLTNYMNLKKEQTEKGEPEDYLYKPDTKYLTYKDFVDKELILFSHADLSRSVPSMVDGLKPGQRKILYTFFTKYKNSKKEIKVAQASGGVSEHSAYHHGEVSLQTTIVGMAQNFVGSNNLNLLLPNGQFGTRLQGGKDSASARYIFTQLSPLARLMFPPVDDNCLKRNQDDGQLVEPEWYAPILPLVLINGTDGIGTGWSTKIPNHSIRDVLDNIKRMIRGEEPKEMHPKYKNYRGDIVKFDENRYVVHGEVAQIDDTHVEITELPIKTWTSNYKDSVLDVMLNGKEVKSKDAKDGVKKEPAEIKDVKDHCTDTTVRFVVEFPTASKMLAAEKEGMHKFLKLTTTISHENTLVLFDHNGCLQKYKSTTDILKDFFGVRMQKYVERKQYLIGLLTAEFEKLANQCRFVQEICEKKMVITNKKKKTLISMMIEQGYQKDPLRAFRMSLMSIDEKRAAEEKEAEELAKSDDSSDSDSKGYEYLLAMPLWSLTSERKEKLEKQMAEKKKELDKTKATTKEQFWMQDLDVFEEALVKMEEKEIKEEEESLKKAEKKSKKGMVAFGSKSKAKGGAVNKEAKPDPDAIRIEPKYEAPVKREKKASGDKKVKKETKTEKAAKSSKKLTDLGFASKAASGLVPKTEKLTLEEENIEKKGKANLDSKPKKSALKKKSPLAERNPESTKRPPKKRKKMDWETESEDEESEVDYQSDSSTLSDFAAKLPSRKTEKKKQNSGGNTSSSKKKAVISDSEDDGDDEIQVVEKKSSPAKPKKAAKSAIKSSNKASTAKKAEPNKKAKAVIESSQEEEDDDLEEDSESDMQLSDAEEEIRPSSRASSRRGGRERKAVKYNFDDDDSQEDEEEIGSDNDSSDFEMVD